MVDGTESHSGFLSKPAPQLDQVSGRTGVESDHAQLARFPKHLTLGIMPGWSVVDACRWSSLDAGSQSAFAETCHASGPGLM